MSVENEEEWRRSQAFSIRRAEVLRLFLATKSVDEKYLALDEMSNHEGVTERFDHNVRTLL